MVKPNGAGQESSQENENTCPVFSISQRQRVWNPSPAFTISPLTQRPRPLTTHSTPTPAARHRSFKMIRILVQPPGSPSASGPILFGFFPHAASFDVSAEDLPARLELGDDRLIGQRHRAVLHRPRGDNRNRRPDRIQERRPRRGHAAVVANHEDLSRKGVRTAGHEDLLRSSRRSEGWRDSLEVRQERHPRAGRGWSRGRDGQPGCSRSGSGGSHRLREECASTRPDQAGSDLHC